MRLRSFIAVLGAACLLFVTGGPSSLAEGDSFLTRDPTLQRGRGFFSFGPAAPAPTASRPRPRVAPPAPRRAAPVVVRDDPVIPKVDIAHHILVIGDSLGMLLANGLDDALNDRPDVAVIHKARPDSGLVRQDFLDWPKVAAELLEGDQKVSLGVVMLGLNDRQAIREGDVLNEPLSPRWLELYRQRIDAVAAPFAAKGIPLIWVGAPPVQNARLSADFVTFNELFRHQVEKAGGQYVDLWGAFVDTENRYTAMGPDVSGQSTRLRLGDGIHFTTAGARKAAHFVDVLIRRTIEAAPQTGIVALPGAPPAGPELQQGGVERMIDAMVGNLAASHNLPAALKAKPLAGPILPLSGRLGTGEQALLASIAEARGSGEIAARLDQVFSEGVVLEPQPGRLDDNRWPR